ncbi:MAG TPA: NERD domain-containing protein [Elusimicrobiales bacterium]|nr:NERD domain-containing protein [Elusimicrobiales bacterium]
MAEIIGESGAWGDIRKGLLRVGLKVGSPADIAPLLERLKTELGPSIERKTAEAAAAVGELERQISALLAEPGFFCAIVNWFLIAKRRLAIRRVNAEKTRDIASLRDNVARLEYLQNSPELAGARAELAVVEQLKRLPAGYIVLNDVRLRASRFHRYNKVPLQSAQIDHLVISPAGIFVIETKVWSREFVESGSYHDPFDQVGRARYLCYDTVKPFGKVQVRGIIACAGHLPDKPDEAKVAVRRVEELNGYITYFKDRVLSPELVAELKEYLGHMVGGSIMAGVSPVLDVLFARQREKDNTGVFMRNSLLVMAGVFFLTAYFIKGEPIPFGYLNFGPIFYVILLALGAVSVFSAVTTQTARVVKRRVQNKVAVKTGLNVSGYKLRSRWNLIESLIALVTALIQLITSKVRVKIVESEAAGGAPSPMPAQPMKSRAVLIPTEPPPLSKEERDRKYMPPAMREALEAQEKAFTDAHPVCPHCNKPLVLRVYGKGPDAGKRFWGCHNYPVCRHTAAFE